MTERITRGKTRPGRLGLLDSWLVACDLGPAPRVVDVGIGASPETTVELFEALRTRWPAARVLGIDVDPVRVEAAMRAGRPGLSFALRGFDLELERPASAIRAMNVLRQYPPEQVSEAHARWGRSLAPGGILLEGSTNRTGDVLACHVLRRGDELFREALLFGTRGVGGFAPMQLRDVLPRDLRRSCRPDHPLGAFFARWTEAWEHVRTGLEPRAAFEASARELARRGESMDLRAVHRGVIGWAPAGGIPESA